MPALAGAAIAAEQGAKGKVARIRAYMKAHWKELLALTFAAIPALFIVFHKGTQQQVAQALQPLLNAVPGGAGSPGIPGGAGSPGTPAGPSGGGDPGTSIPSPSASSPNGPASSSLAAALSSAPSSSLGISINGSNPTTVQPPPKATSPVALPNPTGRRVSPSSTAAVAAPGYVAPTLAQIAAALRSISPTGRRVSPSATSPLAQVPNTYNASPTTISKSKPVPF